MGGSFDEMGTFRCVEGITASVGGMNLFIVLSAVPQICLACWLLWPQRWKRTMSRLKHAGFSLLAVYYVVVWVLLLESVLAVFVYLAMNTFADQLAHTFLHLAWYSTEIAEVSVLMFISHGYESSGFDALKQTVISAVLVVCGDTTVVAVARLAGHVDLSVWGVVSGQTDLHHGAGYYFIARYFVMASVYFIMYILPVVSERHQGPASIVFVPYIRLMWFLNIVGLLSALVATLGLEIGMCGLAGVFYGYYAFYPAVLYISALWELLRRPPLEAGPLYSAEELNLGVSLGGYALMDNAMELGPVSDGGPPGDLVTPSR